VYLQAGHGLAAAHAAGIVHRDFKPDNMLMGDDGRVRVIDFGLARPGEPTREEAAGVSSSRLAVELTQDGSFVGTPAYMSPEQLMRDPADAKSDQFSFCVALYEALYGFRPFPGADTAAIKEAVLYEDPLPPPRGTEVPGWVHQALLRGLSRESDRRYHDMPELLAALAADPSARRRRRLGIAGIVLASGLAAGGGGVAMHEWQATAATICAGGEARLAGVWDPAVAEATRAALVGTGVPYAGDVATRVVSRLDAYAGEWARMHREACETHRRDEQSDALFDLRMACLDERRTAVRALALVLADADAEVVTQAVQAAENVPAVDRCADVPALLAQSPPPEDPEVARAVDELRPRIATLWAKYDVGQATATEAALLRDEAEALAYAPVLAHVLQLEGLVADLHADYKAAEAALVRAMVAADAAGDDDRRARIQLDLTRVVGLHQARFEEGLRFAELTRGTMARLGDTGALEAMIEGRLGEISLQQGQFDRAERHIDRTIELQLRIHGEASPQFATAVTARGTLHFFRGELPGALADYRQAVTLYEELYGVNHPMLGSILNNVGAVELTQFDNDAAQATFSRARQILEDAYGETHPALGTLHTNLGMIAVFQGRMDQAVAEFRRSLAIYEKQLPENHPTIAACLKELGEAQLFDGDLQGALATSERSLAMHIAAYGAGHSRVSAAFANLGMVLLRAGDQVGAEKAFMSAMVEFRGAADEPELGRAYAGLGVLRVAQGRVEEAVPNLEEGLGRLRRNPNAAPFHVAEAQFALAQALWRKGPVHEARVRELAADAQNNFSTVGPGFQAEVARVRGWLAQLPDAVK
jgi:tetratricopeptide (TPR) repeat protein